MDATLHQDGTLSVIVPGADPKKPGECQKLHVQPTGTFTSAIFDVCKSKTNYQYCTLGEEAQFAAFASADGMKYRVINLENGELINELTRGSTSAITTSLCLS